MFCVFRQILFYKCVPKTHPRNWLAASGIRQQWLRLATHSIIIVIELIAPVLWVRIVLSDIVVISAAHHIRILGYVKLLAMIIPRARSSTVSAVAVHRIAAGAGEIVHLIVVGVGRFAVRVIGVLVRLTMW